MNVGALHLVFTDLDGSLLDHDSYSFDPARPALRRLEALSIPLILVSSKTRSEILGLRAELGNHHPFIAENGAAVYIPEGYFPTQPPQCTLSDGFWVRGFSPPLSHWTGILAELKQRFPGSFRDFSSVGAETVAGMTGLPLAQAILACQREFSEPLQWCGSDHDLEECIAALEAAGARVQKGGRFYTVAGRCDKGAALRWLRDRYLLATPADAVYDLAIGDGDNDVPMLEAAHAALLIPAPERPLPTLDRRERVLCGEGYGPHAWAWGVNEWLRGRQDSLGNG